VYVLSTAAKERRLAPVSAQQYDFAFLLTVQQKKMGRS
jgi:hypothetical protein